MLNVFEHEGLLITSMQKIFKHNTQLSALTSFYQSAGNNLGMFKNSTEHAKSLFIMSRQFP